MSAKGAARAASVLRDTPCLCPFRNIWVYCVIVTRAASAKSRQAIRKARKQNPEAAVIITGCLPAGPSEESASLSENLIIVPEKNKLPDTLYTVLNRNNRQKSISASKPRSANKIKRKNDTDYQDFQFPDRFGPITQYTGQTRAFLKIQDGCDAHCTYCIIPKIRTRLWSKPADIILREARSLIDAGHPEIVLTGIFLGAWGRDTARRKRWDPAKPSQLPELIRRLAQIPRLSRLRLSSLEPADVTDELIKVYQKYPVLAPHLHLPLQSGSTHILKRMARQYTAEEYLQICEKLKTALDRPAVTTDIIVGFPGETDEDFEKTLEMCGLVNFAKIHVFPFSPRPNTPAARLTPQIPSKIIRQRADRLTQLDHQLQEKFRRQFIGETVEVILEQTRPPHGRCERYFRVDCSALEHKESFQKGQILHIPLTQ